MTDKYKKLVDTETWNFITETEACYPPDAIDLTVKEQRDIYYTLCRKFHRGAVAGVTSADGAIQTATHDILIRIYQSSEKPIAKVVYYHGGGFVVGGLESHDDVCAEICKFTGFEVISVDYRLSPEHPFPADFEDAFASFNFIASQDSIPVIVCGDSAGGNLAAAVSHAARGSGKPPAGQVLIYPALGSDYTLASHRDHANAPMLTLSDMKYYGEIRSGGDVHLMHDQRAAPLNSDDFSNLPATFVVTAECDPLASDGDAYVAKINAAGGEAIWINEAGLVHGFLRARHSVKRARDSFDRILNAIQVLGISDTLPIL